MERHELERMLLDPDSLKKFIERATAFRKTFGEVGNGSGNPASRIMPVKPQDHARRPTADEVQSNDGNFTVRSGANFSIAQFLSAERGSDLQTDLRLARKACSDKPSDANWLFLEIAITQLTSQRVLDEKGEKAVEDAINVLTTADRPNKAKGDG